MLVTHEVTVDVGRPKQPNVIHVVQGDSMRILRIRLKNNNAVYDPEADLESGETMHVAVTFDKSDGTKGGYERAAWQPQNSKAVSKISAGVYDCILDQQCFSAPGFTHIFIRFFTSPDKTLYTFSVVCAVEKNPASELTSEDYYDYPSIAELLKSVVKYTAQTPTVDEQAQARENIGVDSAPWPVLRVMKEDMPTGWGQTKSFVAPTQQYDLANEIFPRNGVKSNDYVIGQNGYVAKITSLYTAAGRITRVEVSGTGAVIDAQRERNPQVLAYLPEGPRAELPSQEAVVAGIATQSHLVYSLFPAIQPIVGDVLVDYGSSRAAKITGTIDDWDEQTQMYFTTVTGLRLF